MKKMIITIYVIQLIFSTSHLYASQLPVLDNASYPLRGESDLEENGLTSTIDWIVSNTALTSNIDQNDFVFAYDFSTAYPATTGDYNAYQNESSWYYYFQIENTSGRFLVALSMDIYPDAIISAGFILNADLDTDLNITHSNTDPGLSDEIEIPNAPLTNFSIATYDPHPPVPNLAFNVFPALPNNYESTIFFISGTGSPEYYMAKLLGGPQGPIGLLPVPVNSVPEPISLIMFGVGIFGLYGKFKSIFI